VTLCFLTLCALVGSEKVFNVEDRNVTYVLLKSKGIVH